MRIVVSAGPTREFIDPVRFLSNRSTGKMGYAVAQAAIEAGHETVLVSGPVAALEPPPGLEAFVSVTSAREMLAALRKHVAKADALVMTAAVADFRPAKSARRKIHKANMPAALELVPNPDILATLAKRKGRRVFVGFAAETERAAAGAAEKLRRKGLDLVVANDVTQPGAGFATDTNIAVFVGSDGSARSLPLMAKTELGRRIVREIEELAAARKSAASSHCPDGIDVNRHRNTGGRAASRKRSADSRV